MSPTVWQPTFNAVLLLVAAFCAPSCLTAPPERIDSKCGVVYAQTFDGAIVAAELLDAYHPRVRRLLPGCKPEAVTVWLQKELRSSPFSKPSGGVVAMHDGVAGRIHLRHDSEDLPRELVHELVHAMMGEGWESLPPILEEGLADQVAAELAPGGDGKMRVARLLAAIVALGGFEGRIQLARPLPSNGDLIRVWIWADADQSVDPEEAFQPYVPDLEAHSDSTRRGALYGLGFLAAGLLIEELGYQGLFELCEFAADRHDQELVANSFEAATGLALEHDLWIAAAVSRLEGASFDALAHSLLLPIAKLLAEAAAPLFDSMDSQTFLDVYAPVFRLTDDGPETDLTASPLICALLDAYWGKQPVSDD